MPVTWTRGSEMKVKELMQYLSSLDPETQIVVWLRGGTGYPLSEGNFMKVQFKEDAVNGGEPTSVDMQFASPSYFDCTGQTTDGPGLIIDTEN